MKKKNYLYKGYEGIEPTNSISKYMSETAKPSAT